jgi:hypothetical protein
MSEGSEVVIAGRVFRLGATYGARPGVSLGRPFRPRRLLHHTLDGTVKLSSKGTEKRRGSLELQTYGAALAPVISAHIANACARTARYSAAGR